MVKKLVLSCCLAFELIQGDCWGMQGLSNGQNVLSQSSSNQTGSSAVVKKEQTRIVEADTIGGNMTAQNQENDSSCSSFSSEDWIDSRKELISRACYDESAFCTLIDEITDSSDSEEDKKSLYKCIESTWNDENIFEAEIFDGIFYSYRRERFD